MAVDVLILNTAVVDLRRPDFEFADRLVGKGGLFGNCLRVAPPLPLTAAEADEGAAILVDALVAVEAERAR